jgi:hypothetical protein
MKRGPEQPPADDSIEPALLTPRRMAGQLEALILGLYRVATGLRGLSGYVDQRQFDLLAKETEDMAVTIARLRSDVLIGRIPITHGRDEQAGRDRYPLLERSPATSEHVGFPAAPAAVAKIAEPISPKSDEPAASNKPPMFRLIDQPISRLDVDDWVIEGLRSLGARNCLAADDWTRDRESRPADWSVRKASAAKTQLRAAIRRMLEDPAAGGDKP